MSTPSPESLLEHREWMRAIARGLVGDENVVDDVEQRSWMTVMRNRRPVGSVRGWLRSVVKSSAADERRGEARRHVREERASRPEATPPTDHLVAEAEAQRAVAAAVTALPEPYRATILLRYFEGLTPTEIAEKSGVPVDTVKTRLKRGLAMLREALDRDFGDRRRWTLVLLPLADWRAPAGGGVAAAAVGGGLMGIKMQMAAAAVLVAAIVTAVMWTSSDGDDAANATGATAAATDAAHAAPRKRTRDAPAGPPFVLAGRVRSRHDGRPVAGARVTVTGTAATFDTASEGTFRVEGALAGPVTVTADGFRPWTSDAAQPAAGVAELALGDVWLEAAQTLVVEVIGPAGGPVAKAEVQLVRRRNSAEMATTDSFLWSNADPDLGRSPAGSASTTADGTATFGSLGPGSYQALVRAAGCSSGSTHVELAVGRPETRSTVRLEKGNRVAGRVVSARGEPVAACRVDADTAGRGGRASAQTDADGRFVLDDVAGGDVDLRAGRSRGENTRLATIRVPDVAEIELVLPATGSVAGRVTLADGSPVAGAVVGVETSSAWNVYASATSVTGADGRYRIDEIAGGPIRRFVVRHAGLYHVGPRLEAGEFRDRRGGAGVAIAARVDVGNELVVDATMAKGARLHGRVTGPEGGVGGAWVSLHLKASKAGQEWETATCDGEGRYEFDYLPPGPAAALPLHPAYVHPDTPADVNAALAYRRVAEPLLLELPEGGDVERDFAMVAAPRVSGRVLGADGAPVEGAVVRCESTGYASVRPPTPGATTDADGTFDLSRVAVVGKCRIGAVRAGLLQSVPAEVELVPGADVTGVEVRMTAAPVVAGRVLDADGAPTAGVLVVVQSDTNDRAPVRPVTGWTGEDGSFVIASPRAEGRFVVVATAQGREPATATVDVTPSGATVELRFAAASGVSGRVVGSGDAPVEDATVLAIDTSDPKRPAMWNFGDLVTYGTGQDTIRAISGADGRFRLPLRTGPWKLVVRKAGLFEDVADVTAPAAGELEFRLRPTTTMTGTITGDDGKPLVGTVVLLDPGSDVASARLAIDPFGPNLLQPGEHLLSRRTNSAGGFAFPGIPDGTYSLVVVLPRPAPQRFRQVRFGPLRPSGSPHALTMSAPVSNVLAGRLVGAGGAAYVDARVRFTLIPEKPQQPNAPMTRVGFVQAEGAADGTFRFEGLTELSYTLQAFVSSEPVQRTGPDGVERTVHTKYETSVFHHVRPPATDLQLEMRPGLKSSGRLLDDDGRPLTGYTVNASASNGDPTVVGVGATVRADGTFDLERLEDVDYAVTLFSADAPWRRVIAERPLRGGAPFGDLTATLEARIRGVVVDKSGGVVEGAEVACCPEKGGIVLTTKSAAGGAFDLTGLEPGVRYRLAAKGAEQKGPSHAWESGVVHPSGARDVRLVRE